MFTFMKDTKKKASRVYKNFGNEIRSLRKGRQMTQAELAKKVGMHREQIVIIESAKYGNVNLIHLERFAKAFDISPVNIAVTIFK